MPIHCADLSVIKSIIASSIFRRKSKILSRLISIAFHYRVMLCFNLLASNSKRISWNKGATSARPEIATQRELRREREELLLECHAMPWKIAINFKRAVTDRCHAMSQRSKGCWFCLLTTPRFQTENWSTFLFLVFLFFNVQWLSLWEGIFFLSSSPSYFFFRSLLPPPYFYFLFHLWFPSNISFLSSSHQNLCFFFHIFSMFLAFMI